MAVGLAANPVANAMLDLFGNATSSGYATPFVKLHTADPGAAGTVAASAETARKAVTFAAASGGSKSANGTLPSWTGWTAGTETISHLSVWTASTAGTFLGSITLSSPKTVNNTDTLNITAVTLSVSTLAGA